MKIKVIKKQYKALIDETLAKKSAHKKTDQAELLLQNADAHSIPSGYDGNAL